MSEGDPIQSGATHGRVRRHVLLVEQDPDDARAIRDLLERESGLCVNHVPSLAAGSETLSREHYDAILVDLALPILPQREALQEAARWAPRIPILAVTPAGDTGLEKACLEAGIHSSIHKRELRYETLLQSLEHAIERHRTSSVRHRSEEAERHPFFRAEPAAIEAVDLRLLVSRVARAAEERAGRKARVETTLTDVPAVRTDPSKLSQVLAHLLLHALEEAAKADPERPCIRLSTRQHDTFALLVVEDAANRTSEPTNMRIEPPVGAQPIDRVMQPGLMIASEILAGFGASIMVGKEPGSCLPLALRLPLVGSDRGVAGETSSFAQHSAQPKASPARLLLIDDQEGPRRVLQRMLARHHEVTAAATGMEALELIQRSDPFDLIVCDLMMPELDGPAVFERAIAIDARLERRFLFLSGGAFTERTQRFLERSAQPLVSKPISRSALLGAIDRVLAKDAPRPS